MFGWASWTVITALTTCEIFLTYFQPINLHSLLIFCFVFCVFINKFVLIRTNTFWWIFRCCSAWQKRGSYRFYECSFFRNFVWIFVCLYVWIFVRVFYLRLNHFMSLPNTSKYPVLRLLISPGKSNKQNAPMLLCFTSLAPSNVIHTKKIIIHNTRSSSSNNKMKQAHAFNNFTWTAVFTSYTQKVLKKKCRTLCFWNVNNKFSWSACLLSLIHELLTLHF